MSKVDKFPAELPKAKQAMNFLLEMHKRRLESYKKGKPINTIEHQFPAKLEAFDKLFQSLESSVKIYAQFQPGEKGWPFKDKPSQADLTQRKEDFNRLKDQIDKIRLEMPAVKGREPDVQNSVLDLFEQAKKYDGDLEKGANKEFKGKSQKQMLEVKATLINDQDQNLDLLDELTKKTKYDAQNFSANVQQDNKMLKKIS